MAKGEPAPFDGLLLTRAETDEIDATEVELLAELAAARVLIAKQQEALQANEEVITAFEELEIALGAEAKAELAVCKASQPTWIERHIGFCAGVGGYYDPASDDAGFALQALYGFRF